ncbi:MAG TPA: CaiB/BaiF CoA-transferase family protein [Acidimicrobiia bacterium]|nr:CaiB/BaiF CoA-transferase family protein [Acidimicrobiia bacterium]
MPSAERPRPLDGIRVLDLTRLLPGNFCTLALALLGADVIKVEDRGAGDYMRVFGHQVDGAGAAHHLANRDKRSLCLDLKDPADRAVFTDLVRSAHVLVESFRPGVLDRLGFGAQALHAIRPDLVVASISGYGATGPLAQAAGHDLNYLAFSGFLHRLGERGGPGVPPPIPLSDLVGGGLLPALLIVAYLRRAEDTGIGAHIDAAMAEGIALLPSVLTGDVVAGAPIEGRGHGLIGGGLACYGVYPAADGEIVVGALERKFWDTVCDVVGTLDDYRDRHEDPTAQDDIRKRLEEFFAPLSRDEVVARFSGHDACVSPVLSYEEMLASPQAVARQFLDPNGPLPIPTLAFPAMVDGRRLSARRGAPRQGDHSAEVLAELRGQRRPDKEPDHG